MSVGPRRRRDWNPGFLRVHAGVAALFVLLACFASVGPSEAGRGRWSPPQDWHNIAVHMGLLPGDNSPYLAHVVWWVDEDAKAWYGGDLGWKASGDDIDCSSYPAAKFESLVFPDPGVNLFCAGLTHLPDGRLLAVGGTEIGSEYGIRDARAYGAGTGSCTGSNAGSWTVGSQPASMVWPRWYPSATMLPNGRVLATSGSMYPHIEYFGGLSGGAAVSSDRGLYRFGVNEATTWDPVPPLEPDVAHRPDPRYGHSATNLGAYNTTLYFGGRDTANQASNKLWFQYRNPAPNAADYDYDWVPQFDFQTSAPLYPRAFHSAIPLGDSTLIVWGGLRTNGPLINPTKELWRLRLRRDAEHPTSPIWFWDLLNDASTSPGPRLRHKAIYDRGSHRMIVFGGASDTSSTLSDAEVWALDLPDSSTRTATWHQLVNLDGSTHPSALQDHDFVFDNWDTTFTFGSTSYVHKKSALLFGGRNASGTPNHDLWRLVFVDDTHVRWRRFTVLNADSVPSARYAHALTLNASTLQVYLFGGLDASAAAVPNTVWLATTSHDTVTWHSRPGRPSGGSPAWQSASVREGLPPVFDRVPEIYDPLDNAWSHATTGNRFLLQEWYPQMFVAPDGRVLCSGPGEVAYTFNPNDGQWTKYPNLSTSGSSSGFVGGSAVMYRPGKVLKVGTRDTEVQVTAVPTSKTINILPGSDSLWHASGNMSYGRVNMNLTLLPTGKVLVTGGTSTQQNFANIGPVRRPEIWDPDANDGLGVWSGGDPTMADTLSASTVNRGYHSTALLLPDGRVLCAGGNGDNIGSDYNLADIFCPPYLFTGPSSDTLAARPTHTHAPARHLNWGRIFTIATSRAGTIKSVCLIKAGATTHAFNMDQRYVPLRFVRDTTDSPPRLFVTAPSDSNVAPPGDYMLFMVDSTSATAREVPSIATWLNLSDVVHADSADWNAPKVYGMSADVSTDHIWMYWTAPADDDTIRASGPLAKSYSLRRSFMSMTTQTAWDAGTGITAPSIDTVGHSQSANFTGLAANTWYYLGVRATDDNTNITPLPSEIHVRTLTGGGEIEDAARHSGGGDAGATAAQSIGAGTLVVRTKRTDDSTWVVDVHRVASAQGLGLPDTVGVFSQMPNGSGGYSAADHLNLGVNDAQVGLGALLDGRRMVLAGGFALEAVAPRLHSGTTDYVLTSAKRGGAGDLGSMFIASGGALSLAEGDSLSLTYHVSPTPLDSTAGSWFALIAHSSSAALLARPQRPGGALLPTRFALRQNQPNPFARSTSIRFDLPVGAMVHLEVFDAQGRRVQTLANRFFPAGYQWVTWDPSRGESGRMGPGVYFYRIQAGTFRDRKKLVLMGN